MFSNRSFKGRLYCPEEGEEEVEDGVAEEEDAFMEEELCQRREVDICSIKVVAGGRHTVECKGDKR